MMNGKHILFYILDAYNMKSIYNVLHVFLMNPAQSKPKTDLYCSETNIHVIYTKFPEQLPYFSPSLTITAKDPQQPRKLCSFNQIFQGDVLVKEGSVSHLLQPPGNDV